MKVVIASDHGGFEYKNIILEIVKKKGFAIEDLGNFDKDISDDYPDYARLAAAAIINKTADRAIIICGSGAGVSIAANKFKGVRAALCHDTYTAHQCVEHDAANVLCMGQRVIGIELATEVTLAFLTASFSNEERHARRLKKVTVMEDQNLIDPAK